MQNSDSYTIRAVHPTAFSAYVVGVCRKGAVIYMGKSIDFTGQRFGRLTVVEKDCASVGTGQIYWICRCDCGNYSVVPSGSFKNGNSKSCGCGQREAAKMTMKKHGLHQTRVYSIWCGIKGRCYNQNCKSYMHYGGRGIKMCDEWRDDFQSFYDWAMANGYEERLEIDRIDNNGNYEPSNCRWATRKEQVNNTRRNAKLEYCGETHNITEWGEITSLGRVVIKDRIYKLGWGVEKTLSTPLLKHYKNRR